MGRTKKPSKRYQLAEAIDELHEAIEWGLDHLGHANWPGREQDAAQRIEPALAKVKELALGYGAVKDRS